MRAQWMSAAVSRPASRKAGTSSTPSNPLPSTSRRTACSACHLRHHVAAQRRVAAADQLDPRAASLRNGDQAASGERVQLGRGLLVEAARVGQDETGRGRTAERGLVGVLLQDGHDLDAVHRLRPGRVIVEHAQQQPVRGTHRANRRPEGIVVRAGRSVVRRTPRPRPAGCPAATLPLSAYSATAIEH